MMDKKQKKRRRAREEWSRDSWQRDKKMKKMSRKDKEGYKDGESERFMKDEGGVEEVRHREVGAPQVRVKEQSERRNAQTNRIISIPMRGVK